MRLSRFSSGELHRQLSLQLIDAIERLHEQGLKVATRVAADEVRIVNDLVERILVLRLLDVFGEAAPEDGVAIRSATWSQGSGLEIPRGLEAF